MALRISVWPGGTLLLDSLHHIILQAKTRSDLRLQEHARCNTSPGPEPSIYSFSAQLLFFNVIC